MSKPFIIITAALLVILVVYLAFLFFGGNLEEVNLSDVSVNRTNQGRSISAEDFINDSFFKQLERYGDFPITIGTPGRPNPFLPF